VIAAAVGFLCGYAVGTLPVAWLVVRRRHGVDLRSRGRGRAGAVDVAAVGGVRTALLAVVMEALKGAAVGVAARLYSSSGWFTALAIAGCVLGDAFPLLYRRSGRGIVPLVSGLGVALPAAAVITAFTAIPAAVFTSMRGRVYEAVVTIAVPVGLLVGTRDLLSLVPAALIVATLLARAWLRRQRRAATLVREPAWQMVLDADIPATTRPQTAGAGHNRRPWDG
jgi:glycerol-3-phosphate acyltransferase PlsY